MADVCYMLTHKKGFYCSCNFTSVFNAMYAVYLYDNHNAFLPEPMADRMQLETEIQGQLLNDGEPYAIGDFTIGFAS